MNNDINVAFARAIESAKNKVHELDVEGWPTHHKRYVWFKTNHYINPRDVDLRARWFKKMLAEEFGNRNVKLIARKDYMHYFWLKAGRDELPAHKSQPRVKFRIELDEFVRQPDPVFTRWQRFLHWYMGKSLPKSPIPKRVVRYYTVSQFQAKHLMEFLMLEEINRDLDVYDHHGEF